MNTGRRPDDQCINVHFCLFNVFFSVFEILKLIFVLKISSCGPPELKMIFSSLSVIQDHVFRDMMSVMIIYD